MASSTSKTSQSLNNFPSFSKTKIFHSNTNYITFPISTKSPLLRLVSYNSTSTSRYNEVVVDEEVDKIRRLQNGSDVRGVALEGEKGRSVDLTPPAVEAIAESFGEWVINELKKERVVVDETVKVSVGRDPRISGPALSVAVFAGLVRAGCVVYDIELATTPACFMSTLLPSFMYDASIMMTASHLPYTRNGLKFFTRKGGLTSTQVEEICNKAAKKYVNRLSKVSTTLRIPPTKVNFMSAYANHLRDIIKQKVNHPLLCETPLEGFQVDEEVDKIRALQNGSDVSGVALEGSKRRRTVHLTPPVVEAIAAISHAMTTLLPSFMHNACILMAFVRNKSNVIQDFNIKVVGWAIQVGAIWATVAEPAFGVTGVNEEEDLIWVLIQLGISAFVYFIVVPPIIMNWLRIRWYRRNLLEMYLQFMFVFMFFPGILLWAPFLNFRKFPRDPSMKYPWSVPQDPSQIKGGFLKYPWAQPEDYE